MHFFQWIAQYQYLFIFYSLFAVFLVLLALRRLPTVASIQALATMLNTRGGNILVLVLFSWFFFVQAMRLMYQLVWMVQTHKLTADNAFAQVGLQFVTSSAFGGAFGALLKTMTGESPIIIHAEPAPPASASTPPAAPTPPAPSAAPPPVVPTNDVHI